MAQTITGLDATTIANNVDVLVVHQGGTDKKISFENLLANVVSILPRTDLQYQLGDATHRFTALYADEVFVGQSSLYVNGKKVIEDESDVMTFETDPDQAVQIKTTATTPGVGNANLTIQSGNEINMTAPGGLEFEVSGVATKNISFTNGSAGGQITFAGQTVMNGDLTVSGNLTVQGNVTQVNTTQVNISDNLIQVNSDQTGAPLSTLIGGIEINRGDEMNYRLVFEESTDLFKVGEQGALQAVATRQDAPVATAIPYWNDTAKRFDTSTDLQFNGTDLTVVGRRVVTTSSGTSFPTPAGLGDECFRTDTGEWFKYTGAEWVQI